MKYYKEKSKFVPDLKRSEVAAANKKNINNCRSLTIPPNAVNLYDWSGC